VVKIAKMGFNREMSSYLKHKKHSEPWHKRFLSLFKFERKAKPAEKEAEEGEKMEENEATAEDLVEEAQSGEKTEEEIKEEYERKQKKGFFARLFGKKHEEDEEEFEEHEELTLNDDVKRVLKIQNDLIKKLPIEDIKAFKESEDFIFYKETLKRYNLIKEKK
jgi:hypothetical protein